MISDLPLRLTEEQGSLYLTNAWFRAGVDEFLQTWMPIILAGLANDALTCQKETTKQLKDTRLEATL